MSTKRHVSFLWLLALILMAFITWSAFFEIDQAVRATGQIMPGSRTQILQAADGGVVAEIRVKEGQSVETGEVLAVLEKDRSRAAVEESKTEIAARKSALIRLQAEAQGTEPQFPDDLMQDWPEFVATQQNLYAQRKAALNAELSGLDQMLSLARRELKMHKRLFASGDVAQVELMRVERQVIDLSTQRQSALEKYRTEARTEITKVEEERARATQRLNERQAAFRHTEITAPMAGVVKYIRLTTEGGVLRPGDELMQISPIDDEPIIEIKVNPMDIGNLQTGLTARIRLDAFDSSIFGTLSGEVTYISPDTLAEQGSEGQQQVYYRAHVRINWENIQANVRIQPQDIKPGMTATVDIVTGRRTVLEYLAKPIHRAFSGALIEQ